MDDAWMDEILARPPVKVIFKLEDGQEDKTFDFAGISQAETAWLIGEVRRLRVALHAHHAPGTRRAPAPSSTD